MDVSHNFQGLWHAFRWSTFSKEDSCRDSLPAVLPKCKALWKNVWSPLVKGNIEELSPGECVSLCVCVWGGGIISLQRKARVGPPQSQWVAPACSWKSSGWRGCFRDLRPGMWMGTLDLKDAYFHISISSPHRRFLRFCIEIFFRSLCTYQWRVHPFGLAIFPQTLHQSISPSGGPSSSQDYAYLPIHLLCPVVGGAGYND